MAGLPQMVPVSDIVVEDMSVASSGGCDLTPQVQDKLRRDTAILHQLPAVPATDRSIANAIMVWNAGWIGAGVGPAHAPLSAIRQSIEQLVAASSADCRNQPQAGPRLIYLPDGAGKTTILAVGSGQWTWQQLVGGAVPQTTASGQLAMVQASSSALHAALPPAPLSASAADQTPALNALLASLIGKRSSAQAPYNP